MNEDVGKVVEAAIKEHIVPLLQDIKAAVERNGSDSIDTFLKNPSQIDKTVGNVQLADQMRELADSIRTLRDTVGGLQLAMAGGT